MKKYNDYRTVPLVVYKDNGERVIIGEATINGGDVTAILGEAEGEELMTLLDFEQDMASFTLSVPTQRVPIHDDVPPAKPKFRFAIPFCNCPWNNGTHDFHRVQGHHLNCPMLKRPHQADDLCGKYGHIDEV